jgi:hypothetical protein
MTVLPKEYNGFGVVSRLMTVEEIISRLQAKRSGQGWQARCPAHDDRTPSLAINEGADGRVLLHCHAGCSTDSILGVLGLTHRDLFPKSSLNSGVRGKTHNGNGSSAKPQPEPFVWQACVVPLSDRHVEQLAKWRGYSVEFCSWLRAQNLVGSYNGNIAFPVHDHLGRVVGAHYRIKPKANGEKASWCYAPTGIKAAPLIIGELIPGDPAHCFESQWDAFAFMDVSGDRSGITITRGATNSRLIANLISGGSTLYVWTQNDSAGDSWEKDICANTKVLVKRAKVPSQFKDLNSWIKDGGATAGSLLNAIMPAEVVQEPPRPLIEFRTPSQLKNFVPPPGIVLVGDCHIVRGSVFVIGGAPGLGKSRASVALAEAGATGNEWFGLPVHGKFKTMIIQAENGLFRLSKEFGELDCETLEDYVRVSEPPPFGLCFARNEFKTQLSAAIDSFSPDVVIFDPWNAAARDEKARDYLDTFEALRSVLPLREDAPALGIVAHTRKPKTDEKASGRALLNLLAGSYVLGSVPRTVFVMQAALDDTTKSRLLLPSFKTGWAFRQASAPG